MKITVSLPDQQNEFQVLQVADAMATAKRLRYEVEILDARNHSLQQAQGLLRAMNSEPRPHALIIEPVASDVVRAVAPRAAALGIPCAVLNSSDDGLPDLRLRYPKLPIVAVGSDQVEIGRVQGRQLRALLPNGGNVLYIHGPHAATSAQDRFRGLKEVLGSDISLTVLDGHWSEATAELAVRSWLRLRVWETRRFSAVAAQDDSMARGAQLAIESAADPTGRWLGVPFLGIDGLPDSGKKLVREGRLTRTVIMPSNTGAAIELLHRWLASGVVPPSRTTLGVTAYPVGSDASAIRNVRSRHASSPSYAEAR